MKIIEINKVYQIITTLLSLILTAVVPLLVFLQFGNVIIIYVPNTEFIMITIVIIGFIITFTRYFVYRYPKFSKIRAIFSFSNSLSCLIYIGLLSWFSTFQAYYQPTQIYISFQGVFFLLSLPWIVFLARDIYNYIELSLHESDYITLTRKEKFELKNIVKCPRCGYKTKTQLKRCPRCHTPL